MVKTPKTRHSKMVRDPVTIELEPGAVSRIADDKTPAPDEQPAVDVAEAAVQPDAASGVEEAQHSGVATEAATTADDTVAKDGAPSGGFDYGFEEQPARPAADRPSGENADTAAVASPATPSRSGMNGLAAGILGGVIALAGAGALQFAGILGAPGSVGLDGVNSQVASLQRQVEALGASSDVTSRVDDLSQSLEQVKTDLAALKSSVSDIQPDDGAELAALADKLQQVEASVAALGEAGRAEPVDLAPLNEKLAAFDSSLRSVSDAAAQQTDRLLALEQSVSTLSTAVEAQASQPKIALAIAASALKSALERGAPFAAELETFAAIAPDAPELAELRTYAEKGVPTRAEITAETDAAANAMIAAARPVDENAGFVQRLMSSAESLVKVRPIGAVDGAGVPETVARMEVAVTQADYAAALSEYESLPEAAKAAGAEFAARLKARLEVETRIDTLVSSAMKT